MTAYDQHKSAYQRPLDTIKPQVIGYNGCRLGLAAEKRVVPLACLHLHWDMTTRDGGTMAHEEWRDVVGFEGLYQVSNLGRLRSLDRVVHYKNGASRIHRGKVIKIDHFTKGGYMHITLYKNGKKYDRLIHRLVAEMFIERNDDTLVVDHIDGDKTNNSVSNLRWVTQLENRRAAIRLGLWDGKKIAKYVNSPEAKRNCRKAHCIPVIRSDGQWFESMTDAARASGVNESSVSAVVNGKFKQTNGYSFRRADKELAHD